MYVLLLPDVGLYSMRAYACVCLCVCSNWYLVHKDLWYCEELEVQMNLRCRSRLQRRSNKKVQQEFFEKKRQEKKIASIKLNSPKKLKLGLSQDLLSLHTISRAHDAQTKLRSELSQHGNTDFEIR